MTIEYYINPLTKNIEGNNASNICNAHFWLLVELSGIRSVKVIKSLRDHLVEGLSKKDVCEKNDVSLSYFSLSLKKIIHVYNISALISKYYKHDPNK
ncbi:PbsX family transcriptional regulator [Escherichia coli]|nr:PbsX family transcriptional regulator [Escherichia coli]